jgi:hypothetical protein
LKGLLLFIYIFFIVLGPKFGFVDLSLIVPACLFPFLFKLKTFAPRGFLIFALMILILLCYQFVVQIFNQNFDFDALGRLIRAFLMVFLTGLLFSAKFESSWDYCIRVFVCVVAVHSLIIIAGAVFPSVGQVTSIMLETDRQRAFRSPGLMAGYDIAGMLTIFGLLLVVSLRGVFRSKLLVYLLVATFLSACAFASRVSLALALLICIVWVIRLVFERNTSILVKTPAVLASVAALLFAAYYLLLVLSVTFSINLVAHGTDATSSVVSRFATQDSSTFLWSKMFFLPDTSASLIFGTGSEPGTSDVGYVREIFRYGIVGLLFAVLAHILFLLQGRANYRHDSQREGAFFVVTCCFLLMLIFSLKNNYIFVRGIFPAFLLVTGALRYSQRRVS